MGISGGWQTYNLHHLEIAHLRQEVNIPQANSLEGFHSLVSRARLS